MSDPQHGGLVTSAWLNGSGCATKAKISVYDSNPPYNLLLNQPYSAGGCPTGDPLDWWTNQGLYFAKSGPELMNASAGASLVGVKSLVLTELGYDIRKLTYGGPEGSSCGAGAPRFNVVVAGFIYFIGCNSPAGVVTASGDGWVRIRWGGTADLVGYPQIGVCSAPSVDVGGGACSIKGLAVDSIDLVFDDGQTEIYAPASGFGVAILDNIDANGTLVGQDLH